MKKKTVITIVLLLVICAVLVILPLKRHTGSEFGGADGLAKEMVTEMNPDYEPWFESVFTLPGGETETLLFCLQTAIGALVIGYGFGYFVARKKYADD